MRMGICCSTARAFAAARRPPDISSKSIDCKGGGWSRALNLDFSRGICEEPLVADPARPNPAPEADEYNELAALQDREA